MGGFDGPDEAARVGPEQARELVGLRVDDVYGFHVGRVVEVLGEGGSGAPHWLLVRAGRFGERHTLIPLADAAGGEQYLWLPYERRTVHLAPAVEPGAELTPELERELRAHWEAARAEQAPEISLPDRRPAAQPVHRLGSRGGD